MKKVLIAMVLILVLFYAAGEVFARAGGGGGRGGGGRSSHHRSRGSSGPNTPFENFIGLCCAGLLGLAYSYVGLESLNFYRLLRKKSFEARQVLDKIKSADPAWDPEHIKDRVRKIYFNVQRAWMARNQDLAKEFMSESLYQKHKIMTDAMIAKHEKNILDEIELKHSQAVSVEDHAGSDLDVLWVYITGSMIDYKVNDITGDWISGDRSKKEEFGELWKLIKNAEEKWVLDEIKDNLSSLDFNKFKALSGD